MKKEGFARSSYKRYDENEQQQQQQHELGKRDQTASASASMASAGETDDDDITLEMLRAMPKAEKKLLLKRLKVLEKKFKR